MDHEASSHLRYLRALLLKKRTRHFSQPGNDLTKVTMDHEGKQPTFVYLRGLLFERRTRHFTQPGE